MTLPCHIVDGEKVAALTSIGQQIVSSYDYDMSKFIELAVINTAYNFYLPKSKKQFVITGIRGKADRGVSNTVDATVIIYEADNPLSTTTQLILHQEALIRGDDFTLLPMNLLVRQGKWVNAKTDDNDIHMTIFGYYIPELTSR